MDIGYSKAQFTWKRGNLPETNIKKRLNRGVANDKWITLFPNGSIQHLPFSTSDHCPLLLNIKSACEHIRSPRFRFEAWWTMEESIEQVIGESWESSSGTIVEKLERLQSRLKKWACFNRSNKEGVKRRLTKELETLLEEERDDETLARIIDTEIHLNMEIDKDEMYWEQRARANWLQLADKNYAFFHKYASARKWANTISKLLLDYERETTEAIEIDETATLFFQELFTSNEVGDVRHLLTGIKERISCMVNEGLLSPFREKEVRVTLNGMGPTKALGPDGFPVLFFQSEGLSSLMRIAKEEGLLKGAKASRGGPEITHLLFADDCVLFGEATATSAMVLKDILKEYESCSGQCVNFNKSMIFYSSNTIKKIKKEVLSLLGVKSSSNLEKYLGLPNVVGKRKKESFQNLLDRVLARIDALLAKQGWRLVVNPDSLVAQVFKAKIFCSTLWAIWGDKNVRIHDKTNRSSQKIARYVNSYLNELDGVGKNIGKSSKVDIKWKHPPEQTVKINFDGAFNERNHHSTSGIVAKNSECLILLSTTEIHKGVASAFAAEAIACRRATQIGLNMQRSEIIIEGDLKSIIKKCMASELNKSKIGAYIYDIHKMKSKNRKLRFAYTPRSANVLAYILATETLRKREVTYMIGSVPSYAKQQARNESVREPD
ncbi:hypothetical protein J1N35_010084 [Gossypium stocksii]|uniref:RNase H type-1 domain-containing protein n=1 Tax=Gossypium stocksii TaxID=47602 RepID=A0A9D3VZP9_9ROSI|nr:hypothetical protein J1N35_010084 [Gossypium stocksii]